MAHRKQHTEAGRLHIYGWRDELMSAAAELGLANARRAANECVLTELGGRRVWFKGSPLRGKARWRHALRQRLFGRRIPRVNEYYNLSWLTERLFQAALPLAAGVLVRDGLPIYQFLFTDDVPGAVELRAFLLEGKGRRTEILDELAREAARMHALRFVHRDLYPRNVLVLPERSPRRLVFLDAWRGGSTLQLRGPAYDLACFLLEAPELLTPLEQRAFFARYLETRAAQGRPAPPGIADEVARERSALVRRLERRPDLRRGRPVPPREWTLSP